MSKKKSENAPVHEYRLGRIVGVVWFNEDGNGKGWHSVQLSRLYRDDDGTWQRSQSFGRDDLPLVCKVANTLHTWIHQTWQERGNSTKDESVPAEASAAA
jgi:hypothetical protein